MAHSLSAKKRVRQNERSRARNQASRTKLRGVLRGVADPLIHAQLPDAEAGLAKAIRELDRQAARGLIHKNAAARKKSRLARHVNSLRAKKK